MDKKTPHPVTIELHQKSRFLEIGFDDESHFELPCEYLRIFSPSAEVRGHGPGQQVLQTGKESVNITEIEPVGNYAIKLHFDDGHDTGLYSWDYLFQLGLNKDENWQSYLDALKKTGHTRESCK